MGLLIALCEISHVRYLTTKPSFGPAVNTFQSKLTVIKANRAIKVLLLGGSNTCSLYKKFPDKNTPPECIPPGHELEYLPGVTHILDRQPNLQVINLCRGGDGTRGQALTLSLIRNQNADVVYVDVNMNDPQYQHGWEKIDSLMQAILKYQPSVQIVIFADYPFYWPDAGFRSASEALYLEREQVHEYYSLFIDIASVSVNRFAQKQGFTDVDYISQKWCGPHPHASSDALIAENVLTLIDQKFSNYSGINPIPTPADVPYQFDNSSLQAFIQTESKAVLKFDFSELWATNGQGMQLYCNGTFQAMPSVKLRKWMNSCENFRISKGKHSSDRKDVEWLFEFNILSLRLDRPYDFMSIGAWPIQPRVWLDGDKIAPQHKGSTVYELNRFHARNITFDKTRIKMWQIFFYNSLREN